MAVGYRITLRLARSKSGHTAARIINTFIVLLPLAVNALHWEESNGSRRAELTVPAGGKAGFTLMPPSVTGIVFTNLLLEQRHLTNQILLNGCGVAAGDIDNDGWCDLYFCRLGGPNALYRNLGNWRFEDVTEAAGVACRGLDSTGAAFANIDGD